jgi:hypothetical protein
VSTLWNDASSAAVAHRGGAAEQACPAEFGGLEEVEVLQRTGAKGRHVEADAVEKDQVCRPNLTPDDGGASASVGGL